MDATALLDSMLDVAKAVAPVIGHGAPEVVALGERVMEMIDHAVDTFGDDVPAELPRERDEIEARIAKHVDETAAKLRGDK